MIMLMMIYVIFTKDIIRDINLNEIIQDNIQQFDYRIYRLNIKNSDDLKYQQLVLSLFSQQQNNLQIYIDCDKQPKFLDSYQWQTTFQQQQLKIQYQQRNLRNCSDVLFFIAVLSEQTSNYELLTYVLDGIHFVEYNLPLIGELHPQEIYQFKVQPIYFNEQITIEINIEQAQSYLKKCFKDDCLITKYDYNNTFNGELIDKNTYTFINSDCYNCYYLLGLLSEYKQFFRILVINDQLQIKLKEGLYDQFQVEQGSSLYYIYNKSDLTNIKQIKFQLNQITGDCILYGSSQNIQPSQSNYDSKDDYQIIINKTRQYYLSVYGRSSCKYRIYTIVEREQTINQTQFKQLENGISVLHKQRQLYSFFIIQLEILLDFSIKLQSNPGNFMMYVKSNISDNNEIPDSNSYQWKDTKCININIDKDNQAIIYYISVQLLNTEGEFIIEYKLHDKIKVYEIGDKIIDSVGENQIKYYKFPMLERDLLFIKEIFTENQITNLIIYISLNQTNIFPKEQSNNYIFLNSNLTIPQQELICHHQCQNLKKNQCFIYLSVTSLSGIIFYTITTQQLNNKILLHEGCPLTLSFQQDILFYYFLNEKEVTIQWYSQGGSQAKLLAYLGYLNDSKFSYEQFQPQNSNPSYPIQTIIIPQNNQEYILYIQVQPFLQHFENDMYSIGVYETVKILNQLEKIQDHVEKGQIKYYMLIINENIKSIIFNIQILGDQEQILIFLQQGVNSRPNNLIQSIQLSLQIDTFYIFRQTQKRFFQQDQYILGIQGEFDCEFQLSYQLQNIFYLFYPNGYLPQEIMEERIPTIFLYQQKSPFKIILAVFIGTISIRAKCFHNQVTSLDFTDSFILDDIAQEFKLFQFDACQYEQCQYLIQIIKIEYETQAVIQIQTNQKTIELFENTPQYEVLKQYEQIEYIFQTQYHFLIKLNNVYGQIQVCVKDQHNNNTQYYQVDNNMKIIEYIMTKLTHASFIISIECLTPYANFQILINRKNQKISNLNLGQILNKQLVNLEQNLFCYQSFTSVFNYNNTSKLLTLQIQTIYTSIEFFDIQLNHSNANPIILIQKQYKKGIFYKLYDVYGKYNLIITPKITQSYISILLSDENIHTLMDSIPQYQLTKVGQPNFYQILLPQKSTLFIEILTCRGTVLIQGTSNPSNLNKQIFEIQIMNKPEQYFNAILQLEEGIYYFLVKLISSQVKDENQNRISNYYIRQQTFNNVEPIPYSAFKFSNVTLNWNIISNQVIIEIPNLIQDYQFSVQPQITIYYIIQQFQQDEFVCIYESYSNDTNNNTSLFKIEQSSSQDNTTKIQLNITDSSKINLNIIGKVEIFSGVELYELTYPFPITELNLEGKQTQEEDNQILYYLILLLIILIVLFISRLLYKQRNIQVQSQNSKNLQIEMNYQTLYLK
ncbi:unnamed protein product [Paramecium primaurelia]|uniref:Transmembrane protein n=1 Tax=Paramecium primaurelia TaxID=5886 RepID=A0A8S1NUS8_PARPR|nr:unnamed protein product [Paramecium primaurelia]